MLIGLEHSPFLSSPPLWSNFLFGFNLYLVVYSDRFPRTLDVLAKTRNELGGGREETRDKIVCKTDYFWMQSNLHLGGLPFIVTEERNFEGRNSISTFI